MSLRYGPEWLSQHLEDALKGTKERNTVERPLGETGSTSDRPDLLAGRRGMAYEPSSENGSHQTRPILTTSKHPQEHPLEDLTDRETEVLKCIAEGNSTKQVAAMLGMAFKTASCHRYRLMDKLDIHDTASLVRYA